MRCNTVSHHLSNAEGFPYCQDERRHDVMSSLQTILQHQDVIRCLSLLVLLYGLKLSADLVKPAVVHLDVLHVNCVQHRCNVQVR